MRGKSHNQSNTNVPSLAAEVSAKDRSCATLALTAFHGQTMQEYKMHALPSESVVCDCHSLEEAETAFLLLWPKHGPLYVQCTNNVDVLGQTRLLIVMLNIAGHPCLFFITNCELCNFVMQVVYLMWGCTWKA